MSAIRIASDGTLLSVEDLEVYTSLADTLIPSAEGMPSASEADVPTVWLERALVFRPDLWQDLRTAIELSRGRNANEALTLLSHENVAAFNALSTLTAGAYFLNRKVRALIEYPGQQPQPVTDDVDTYVDLLEHVIDRGPIYRSPKPKDRLEKLK